jgi:hypothetical protein
VASACAITPVQSLNALAPASVIAVSSCAVSKRTVEIGKPACQLDLASSYSGTI